MYVAIACLSISENPKQLPPRLSMAHPKPPKPANKSINVNHQFSLLIAFTKKL